MESGQKKKIVFKCPDCGTLTKPTDIHSVYKNKRVSCYKCADGRSMPEKLLYSLLEELGVDFRTQVKFDWSNNKVYDFYLPENNMIIETHGAQHYEKKRFYNRQSLEDIQNNDLFKRERALANGIEQYIEINCSHTSDMDNLRSCLDALSNNFCFDNIDLNKIILDSSKSLCIKAGELWNTGLCDVNNIALSLSLHPATVRRYLKKLTEIEFLNTPYPSVYKTAQTV